MVKFLTLNLSLKYILMNTLIAEPEVTSPAFPFQMDKTMKAAVITGPGNIEIKHVFIPEAKGNEIVFKVEGCGLCASHISIINGSSGLSFPLNAGAPGHEAWGTIVAIGDKVKRLRVGDKIVALSVNSFAEYDKVHASLAVKLPAEMEGFPAEPIANAINIAKRANIRRNHIVAVIGLGFLGTLLVQLAKRKGAKVIALSKRESSLHMAGQLGADLCINLNHNTTSIADLVNNFTGGKFCDRVIEAYGQEEALNLAAELAADKGKIVIAGNHSDGLRKVNVSLWNKKSLDIINAHDTEPKVLIQGMKAAVQAVKNKMIVPDQLISHKFSFENLGEALATLSSRPDHFLKGIIQFR